MAKTDDLLIVWKGEEREGPLVGKMTLFIRGGWLGICLGKCIKELDFTDVEQVYFGAGSGHEEYVNVLKAKEEIDKVKSGLLYTVEVDSDFMVSPIYMKDESIRIVAVVPVSRMKNVWVKFRDDMNKLLGVGETYRYTQFDDVNGMFDTDQPIFYANDLR